MFNTITELFLSEYFILMASVGKFVEDRKQLFARLSKVFLIDQAQADALFDLCDREVVREIVTEQDYLRHQRMLRYSALKGDNMDVDCDVEQAIRVKGNALISCAKQKLSFNPQNSRNAEYASIVTAANGGVVTALKILGFLQCEGIFLEKNVKLGVKNLTKVANWNDCVGALALLRYCPTDRARNLSRLRMIVSGAPYEGLFDSAVAAYGVSQTDDIPEVRLLERAFASAILNRSVYNPMYARILYGDVLNLKDKEKAMFSSDAGKLGMLSDLPLKLSERRITAVDVSRLSNVAVTRPAEQSKIAIALSNADLRTYEQYRPLCLVSDSPYVLNMYARAICSHSDEYRCEIINVSDLSGYDLEPSANNVFVRNIYEDVDNRFLLFFTGNISDKTLDFVKNFLIGSRRARFHLNSPNVTLNLGSVLPICFCDKRNARLLEDILDVVNLADVTDEELPQAIEDVIADKSAMYGVTLCLQGTAREVFANCAIDKAAKIIDSVARNHRKDGKIIVINRDNITEYAFEGERKKIGF